MMFSLLWPAMELSRSRVIQSDPELFGLAESRIFFPDPRQDATFEIFYLVFAVFNLMVVNFVVGYLHKYFLRKALK
jgi:hypothetical protein